MRIVTDTNVLISATFWSGHSEKIVLKAEDKKVELILSKEIIMEYCKVMEYHEIQDKIKNKKLEISQTILKIISISTIVEPKGKLDIIKEDPDDNKILECALEGNADYIVSQDKHLLKLKQFKEIKIIKIHRKLLPALKSAGLTEFSFDSGFLGCQKRRISELKLGVLPFLCIITPKQALKLI